MTTERGHGSATSATARAWPAPHFTLARAVLAGTCIIASWASPPRQSVAASSKQRDPRHAVALLRPLDAPFWATALHVGQTTRAGRHEGIGLTAAHALRLEDPTGQPIRVQLGFGAHSPTDVLAIVPAAQLAQLDLALFRFALTADLAQIEPTQIHRHRVPTGTKATLWGFPQTEGEPPRLEGRRGIVVERFAAAVTREQPPVEVLGLTGSSGMGFSGGAWISANASPRADREVLLGVHVGEPADKLAVGPDTRSLAIPSEAIASAVERELAGGTHSGDDTRLLEQLRQSFYNGRDGR